MSMGVVARPPLLVLLLCGEYLLPHEPPHPGTHFLRLWRQPEVHSIILLKPAEAFFGDLQDLLVEVAEVLPGHRARRHPRGNALSDHGELEMRKGIVEGDVVQSCTGPPCVAFREMGPSREARVPGYRGSQCRLVLSRFAPVEQQQSEVGQRVAQGG